MAANAINPIIPKLLGRAMLILRERCTMVGLVNSDFNEEAKEFGKTVDVPVDDEDTTADDVTPAVTAPTPTAANPKTVPLTLDKWKHKDFFLGDDDMTRIDKDRHFVPMQMANRVRALANQINQDIFATYKEVYGYVGDAGTTPFGASGSLAGVNGAIGPREQLAKQRCPLDDRAIVLNFAAEAKALALPEMADVERVGERGAKIKGLIGERYGFMFAADDHVPTHTAGTITTGLIAKAATAQALGLKAIVCTTAASTGACALVVGDIITFAGHAQTYVVTAAATQASAASDVTVNVEPGLQKALVGSEAVTVKATHVVNLAFNRGAIAFANRPLVSNKVERANRQMATMQDPLTGLILRLELMGQYKQTVWDLDILYGVKLVRPQLIVRVAG